MRSENDEVGGPLLGLIQNDGLRIAEQRSARFEVSDAGLTEYLSSAFESF